MTMKRRIAVSQQLEKADIIIRNVQVADVFSLTWRTGNIVIADGYIIAIDTENRYEAYEDIDATGQFAIPGLIDAHIHIESTLLTPSHFSNMMFEHGVTTAITDPHEIANVAGTAGLQYMLDDAANSAIDLFFMLPSSVPGTSFENSGAVLTADDLAPFLQHPQVLGLAEVMDYPAVLAGEDHILAKIQATEDANLTIDGHGAGLSAHQITGYRAANIATDHECITAEEATDRVAQGMYVFLREGSAAKNVSDVLPAVTSANARRFGFCTDDKYVDDILVEGTIDHIVRLAIQQGMDPLQAIQLATLNAAECYGLKHRGALTAGYIADIVLVSDVAKMTITETFKNGQRTKRAKNPAPIPSSLRESVHLPAITADMLAIPMQQTTANVIDIVPNQIVTHHAICDVHVQDGYFVPSIENDFLKLIVIERHHQKHTIGHAIVRGFGLKSGAIATTVAHDSHNALAVGTNDADMIIALERLQMIQGGFVIVDCGQVIAEMPLPIGGLMTDVDAQTAADQLTHVHKAIQQLNPSIDFHLLLTLSFIALPVIPALKITDSGLFNVETFQHISIEHFS